MVISKKFTIPCNLLSKPWWNRPNCARSPDRHFDDPGADGRVERVTVEIFNLSGPSEMSYHILGHQLISKYLVISYNGLNLMSFHFPHPVNKCIEESHSYLKMFLLPSCIPPLDKSVRGRERVSELRGEGWPN